MFLVSKKILISVPLRYLIKTLFIQALLLKVEIFMGKNCSQYRDKLTLPKSAKMDKIDLIDNRKQNTNLELSVWNKVCFTF